MRALPVLATSAVLLLIADPAAAEDDGAIFADEVIEPLYHPRFRQPVRKIAGLDLGLGLFDSFCEGCSMVGGFSIAGYGGAQVTERIALVLDLWTLNHVLPDDREGAGLAVMIHGSAASRLWLTPTTWVQSGLGFGALAELASGNDVWTWGPGGVIAVGRELHHRPGRGIDLLLRVGGAVVDAGGESHLIYTISANGGFHWN